MPVCAGVVLCVIHDQVLPILHMDVQICKCMPFFNLCASSCFSGCWCVYMRIFMSHKRCIGVHVCVCGVWSFALEHQSNSCGYATPPCCDSVLLCAVVYLLVVIF